MEGIYRSESGEGEVGIWAAGQWVNESGRWSVVNGH